MSISSNCLFHFSDKIENIINILSNTFRPRYCLENYGTLFTGLVTGMSDKLNEHALPMVSFCDLPLSNVKEHLEFYGDYGIGLKKKWGINNGLNPILYLCPDSKLCKHFLNIFHITQERCIKRGEKPYPDELLNFFEMVSLIKLYKGKMWRKGKYTEERNFYNEREWRYVPNRSDLVRVAGSGWALKKEEFLDSEKLKQANKLLFNNFQLSFEPDDIKYIIVSKESEIIEMIKKVEEIKDKYNPNTVKLVASRIISAEQIREDF